MVYSKLWWVPKSKLTDWKPSKQTYYRLNAFLVEKLATPGTEVIICPTAIAQHGTDYKITCVCLSFCQSVCKHSYGRNFESILMKFCTVIRGPKSKIEFVWDKNLINPSPILPQCLKNCITAYGDFEAV